MSVLSQQILLPKHIDYVLINQSLIIVNYSPSVAYFFESLENLRKGKDIREGLPELIGCEEIINLILDQKQEDFSLKAITRIKNNGQLFYFDLYLNFYGQDENDYYLILFLEDVTEQMKLEQVLVQSTNETHLLMNQLNRSQDYINKIVNSIADALIVTNYQGIIQKVNPFTLNLFGYEEIELIQQHLNILISDFFQQQKFKNIHKLILAEGKSYKNIEIVCQTKNGKNLIISFSCSPILLDFPEENDQDHQYNIIYIGRDITDKKRHQKRLNIQYAIAKVLARFHDLEDLIHTMLQEICQELDWDVGELWLPDHYTYFYNTDQTYLSIKKELNSLPLKRIDLWVNPSQQLTEFIEVTEKVLLPIGEGLAGTIWQNSQADWVDNLMENPDFGVNSFAVKVGLKTAFGFPIKTDHEVLGIMTFFSCYNHSLDEEITQILLATGNQLGQLIKRKQAELALKQEQAETERLLLNILPPQIAQRLKEEQQTIADSFDHVTVLFADLVGFTQLASHLSAIEIVEILNIIFSQFDQLIEKHGLEKIKTIGDSYMVVGGLPIPNESHEIAIINMALDMQKSITEFNQKTNNNLSLRIGIHTGTVVAGVIGTKKFIYDLWGDTVNIASRMESQGIAGKIQVTEDIYQDLKHLYNFQPRGLINIKGKGEMLTYFLERKKE